MTESLAKSIIGASGLAALKATAFDLIPEPAMVVDRSGALVAANEAAEALFGQGLALLARGRFRAALPPDSALVFLINRALAEGAPVRFSSTSRMTATISSYPRSVAMASAVVGIRCG